MIRTPLSIKFGRRTMLVGAGIIVLEPDNIIFAKVFAVLDFDQNQGNHAGVLQAVRGALGHVGRLVAAEDDRRIAAFDFGGTRDHDPVLAAVVVHLEAQTVARFDINPLDFVAFAFFQNRKGTPRAQFCCGDWIAKVSQGGHWVDFLDLSHRYLLG
jgi:hypothetical protein